MSMGALGEHTGAEDHVIHSSIDDTWTPKDEHLKEMFLEPDYKRRRRS